MKTSRFLVWVLSVSCLVSGTVAAQSKEGVPTTLEEVARSVVALRAEIPPTARTAPFLGLRRDGNGVVIDDKGLILTIGYLILEAERVAVKTHDGRMVPAKVIGYDSDSGFGLLSAQSPLGVSPLPLGDSEPLAEKDPALVVTSDADQAVQAVVVVSRRTFAGYWEYLLEKAIFVAPPQGNYAGAALVDRNFRLVGIGSLFVQDSASKGVEFPGNMFVPINHLKPVLADLIRMGRPGTPPKPWLGLNVAEQYGRLIVTRVSPEGPANQSGLTPGDIILEIGGIKVGTMERFYRQLWSLGRPGVSVQLKLLQRNNLTMVSVASRNRYRHYRGLIAK